MSDRYTVTLGEYKGLHLTAIPVAVTQEEIDAFVERERLHNATLTPIKEPATKGCIVNIDYTGMVDGVPFEGGSAKGYDLELGSGTFVPGFEAQLVGVKRGDNVDVNVIFPEKYRNPDLSGKHAVFHVKVNSVQLRHLPNMTDEFVRSTYKFKTYAQLVNAITQRIRQQKETDARTRQENEAVAILMQRCTCEVSDALIQSCLQQYISSLGNQLSQQGATLDDYLKYLGIDLAALEEQIMPQAKERAIGTAILNEIARVEGIQPTDAQFDYQVKSAAVANNMEPDDYREMLGEDTLLSMRESMCCASAITFVLKNAVIA